MSINDLIHTNAHNAFEQGKKTEQERIIELWDEEMSCQCENPMPHLLERIKGN